MAHMIEQRMIDGMLVPSFAENGQKERAWHGLGEVFDRPMTVIEALKASHADFNVQLQPIVTLTDELMQAIENNQFINASMLKEQIINGYKATMRTDYNETLGVVSDTYGVVQNATAFNFIDTLCNGKNDGITPFIEACGVLGHGERVFITAKFPEQIVLDAKRDDLLDMYAIFTTSHDGTGAVRCLITSIRVCCNNTLQLAFQHNSGSLSFRHTSNVLNRMDLMNKENADFAYRTLGIYELYKQELMQRLEQLSTIKLSGKDVNNIIAEVTLSPDNLKVYQETGNIFHEDIKTRGRNIFLGMQDALVSGIGQDIVESGNALWLINGVTSYYQNHANFKDEEKKFVSIMEGNVHNKVQKAYDLCMKLAS